MRLLAESGIGIVQGRFWELENRRPYYYILVKYEV